jgi:ribonuclease BN (tRNA processing enzyme)
MNEFRFLALAAVAALAPTTGRRIQPTPATRVVMLGSGTPNADPDHSGPSVAIVVGGATYLVDAGPGVVRRAALAQRVDSIAALRMPNLDRVFITHLHSDHTTGLPDLMLSPWVLDRTRPLEVYGPPGTTRMVRLLQDAYSEDIQLRLHGGEPSNKTGYASVAHDVKPGVVYQDSNVTVSAFEVAHGKWEHAFAYRFVTHDRVIVVSGDTRPTDAIVRACDGCDVLVHEVYSAKQLATRTPDWQAYHRAYHTSGVELGDIAARARPKLLVLYHQLYWGADDSELLREVREKFSGNVVSGRDLGVY